MTPQPPTQSGKPKTGSVQALVKVEKLTQIAFAVPVAVAVGWLLGAGLDRWLHRHWIYIAGLLVGMMAGFVQVFRMIAEPGTLAATAIDPAAPGGPGFGEGSKGKTEDRPENRPEHEAGR